MGLTFVRETEKKPQDGNNDHIMNSWSSKIQSNIFYVNTIDHGFPCECKIQRNMFRYKDIKLSEITYQKISHSIYTGEDI